MPTLEPIPAEPHTVSTAVAKASLPGPLCWVLISATPYHDARLSAFAAQASIPPVLLELTDHDPFKCLQVASTKTPYIRRVLIPGMKLQDVKPSAFRAPLFATLDEIKPAAVCVNGWSLPGSIETIAWCTQRRVPAIVLSESTAQDAPRSWWKEAIKRRLLSLASSLLVGGRLHADYARELGVPGFRIFQGYNAVDNAHFENGADAARSNAATLRSRIGLPVLYFLACSRFEPKKNLTRLLFAYSRYRVQAGDAAWALALAGDGVERPALEAQAHSLGIADMVHFLGARSYTELPEIYGLASAFIHASTTEQWGLVVNEAGAAGLPLLVSERCGCAPELVRPGLNGVLFDPYDSEVIAAAMTLIASPGTDREEMGRASRLIARQWSPQRFASSLTEAIVTAFATPIPKPALTARLTLKMLSARPLPYQ